ncbi:MAG: 50S ribosomal protein L11 methyltransferase [Candidatus Omnitrophica bacterium]|nr:50S ribosomal protein L11 methyltransferase [Candidatus Omnitrophota bacterium]
MTQDPVRSGHFTYYEIALSGRGLRPEAKEATRIFFRNRCGVPSAGLACVDYRGSFRACYYTRTLRAVARVRRLFRVHCPKGVRISVKTLSRHDWLDKWKRDYHARPIGKKFLIVPEWERTRYASSQRIPIFLDPGSAFGSGGHETTRLMVRLLERFVRPGGGFLDIGTGSGVLSIVAWKLGARRVVAFDHDKPSAAIARKNFSGNRCRGGDFFRASLKTFKCRERFETVGANLLTRTLIEHQKVICDRVAGGGVLILSGIAQENLSSFRDGFRLNGWKCLRVLTCRKWVALAYRRPS